MKDKLTRFLLIPSVLIVLLVYITGCNLADSENKTRIIPVNKEFQISINPDGSIKLLGKPDEALKYDFNGWKDIKDISVGLFNIVAVKKDGSVLITGTDDPQILKATEWKGIKKTRSELKEVYGLKSDGTVVYAGLDPEGEMAEGVSQWKDVVDIETSMISIFGIKRNGDLVAAGLRKEDYENIKDWHNIKKISVSAYTVAAITDGGEILYADFTVSPVHNKENSKEISNELKGAVKVCASNNYMAVLMPDGTIKMKYTFFPGWPSSVGYPSDTYIQSQIPDAMKALDNATDVIDINIYSDSLVVLKKDGTVLSASFSGK